MATIYESPEWKRAAAEIDAAGLHAGVSRCPLCGQVWLVTVYADCFMPACGCYGQDTSADNPNRPCEPCGMRHFSACESARRN